MDLSSAAGTIATAFGFGRVFETRTSLERTCWRARLGAFGSGTRRGVVMHLVSQSIPEMSMYVNSCESLGPD